MLGAGSGEWERPGGGGEGNVAVRLEGMGSRARMLDYTLRLLVKVARYMYLL